MPIDAGKISSDILATFGKALDTIPIVGSVKQLLSAIGINVKGKTQHISPAQAFQIADVVAYQNFAGILQAGGKELVDAVGTEYPIWLAGTIGSGNYWGGSNSIDGMIMLGYMRDYLTSSDMLFRAKATAYNHVVWIARNVDAENFEEQFTSAYKMQVQQFFIYLKSKYQTLSIDDKGNVDVSGNSIATAGNMFVPLLAGFAIVAAFLLAKKKKK